MAKFTQEELTAPQPTNWSGRSQGLPANRVGEILMEGLATAGTQLVAAKDFQIQQNIRQDVDDVFAGTNAAFMKDEETGFSQVQNRDNVPEEFRNQAADFNERLAQIENARQQGTLTDTHYYSMLAYSMKNLKSKYPGYHEVIDNIYKDVTGVNPANAVANSLRVDQEEAARRSQDGWDQIQKRLWETREFWGDKYPDYLTNPTKYVGKEQEILQYAQEKEVNAQKIKAERDELGLKMDRGQWTEEGAKSVFNEHARKIAAEVMDVYTNPEGVDITKQIMEMERSGKMDPATTETILAKLNTAEMEIREKIAKLGADKGFSRLGSDYIKTATESQLETLRFIRDRINNKEFGLAGAAARRLAASRTADIEALRNIDNIRAVEAATAVNPELGKAIVTELYKQGELAPEIFSTVNQLAAEAAYGVKGMGEIIDSLNAEDITQAEKNEIGTRMVNIVNKVMADPTVTDDQLIKFVQKNFLGDNPSMNQVMMKVSQNGDGRLMLYNKVVSPLVVQRLAQINDDGLSVKALASWAYSSFDDVPQVNTALQNIAQASNPSVGIPAVKIYVDMAAGRLVAAPNPQYAETAAKQRGGDTMVASQLNLVQKDLDKVNTAFGNLKYALDSAQVDSTAYITNLLAMKGVNVQEVVQNGGGSQQGANPLEGTGPKVSNFLPDNFGKTATTNAALRLAEAEQNDSLDLQFDWTEEYVQNAVATGDYKSLLNFVGDIEAPKGYNQVFGNNRFLPREDMTLNEVLAFQTDMLRGGSPSSAVGRYQFLKKTLKGLMQEMGLTGDEPFTPELQDRLASVLVERRGGAAYKAGKISREKFLKNLSMEWASLPRDSSGLSYYAGDGLNKALVSPDETLAVLDELASQG